MQGERHTAHSQNKNGTQETTIHIHPKSEPSTRQGKAHTPINQTKTAHERQRGIEHTNDAYEARKTPLDCSLNEAILGQSFKPGGKLFHIPGAMYFIDLGFEC